MGEITPLYDKIFLKEIFVIDSLTSSSHPLAGSRRSGLLSDVVARTSMVFPLIRFRGSVFITPHLVIAVIRSIHFKAITHQK